MTEPDPDSPTGRHSQPDDDAGSLAFQIFIQRTASIHDDTTTN